MCGKICRCTIRFFLVIINLILFSFGVLLVILAGVLKWDNNSIFNQMSQNRSQYLDLRGVVEVSWVIFLVISFSIIIVSMIGLIGACCAKRSALVLYEILLLFAFILHVTTVLFVIYCGSTIESGFKISLNNTVESVKTAQPSEYPEKCRDHKSLSGYFKCCGYNGVSDFPLEALQFCCESVNPIQPGCAQKAVGDTKEKLDNYFLIPNLVVIAIEFIIIVAVAFLICRSRDKSNRTIYIPITREY